MLLVLGLGRGRAGSFAAIAIASALACNVDPEGGGVSIVSPCAAEMGDLTCVLNHPSRPYCSLCSNQSVNQGCVSNPPPSNCVPGGGFPMSDGTGDDGVPDDGGSTTEDDPDPTLADTTAAVDTTEGEPACVTEGFDRDCEALDRTMPYCSAGACVGCLDAGGDAFCGALASDTPACDGEAGVCVGCDEVARAVCGDVTPVCTTTGACTACSDHDDCPDSACHKSPFDPLAGACFAPAEVRWVNNTALCPGMGTQASPACNLATTVAGIGAGGNRAVRVIASSVPITQRVEAIGDFTLAIVGINGSQVLSGHPMNAGGSLVVGGSALVYVDNLRINDNPLSHGIYCDGAELWLEDLEIGGNAAWGVFDQGPCNLVVSRNRIHHNVQGGVRVLGGTLDIDNSAVAINGNGGAGPGIDLQFATANILYSTIVGNDGASSDSITCNTVDEGSTLRNSIIQGTSAFSISLNCFTFQFSNNAMDNSNFAQGSNVQVPLYDPIQFVNPNMGDFRLQAPPLSPYGGIAQWQAGDPTHDADGTVRPTDALAYVGIDEP